MEELPIVLGTRTIRLRHRGADTLTDVIHVPAGSLCGFLVLNLLEQVVHAHAGTDKSNLPIADVGLRSIRNEQIIRHDGFASPIGGILKDQWAIPNKNHLSLRQLHDVIKVLVQLLKAVELFGDDLRPILPLIHVVAVTGADIGIGRNLSEHVIERSHRERQERFRLAEIDVGAERLVVTTQFCWAVWRIAIDKTAQLGARGITQLIGHDQLLEDLAGGSRISKARLRSLTVFIDGFERELD